MTGQRVFHQQVDSNFPRICQARRINGCAQSEYVETQFAVLRLGVLEVKDNLTDLDEIVTEFEADGATAERLDALEDGLQELAVGGQLLKSMLAEGAGGRG